MSFGIGSNPPSDARGFASWAACTKFRHTFCSHLAMRGAPAKAIQELAGHESLTTTLRYMHLSPGARDQAIALVNTPEVYGNLTATEGGSAAK